MTSSLLTPLSLSRLHLPRTLSKFALANALLYIRICFSFVGLFFHIAQKSINARLDNKQRLTNLVDIRVLAQLLDLRGKKELY